MAKYCSIISYLNTSLHLKKMKTNNELVPFDFLSVMIYSPKDFSINNQSMIAPKDPKVTFLNANQRNELSKLDIEMIHKLYKCYL